MDDNDLFKNMDSEDEEIIVNSSEALTPYKYEVLKKANALIGLKYKASVIENKLTYLAMLKIQNFQYDDLPDGIYVEMSVSEIKNAIGTSSGSIYETLANVANEMTGNNIGVVDKKNNKFLFITLINKAEYSNGRFTIRFANELKNNLVNIPDNFTLIPKEIAMSLKKPYSFPMYQLLKKQCYYPKNYMGPKNHKFYIEIGLAELKLDIGVVNSNATEVRKILQKGQGLEKDYERAVAAAEDSKEAMFKEWREFNRSCLKPTISEINDISDIYVEYERHKEGRGGKTKGVKFTIWTNGSEKKDPGSQMYEGVSSETADVNNSKEIELFKSEIILETYKLLKAEGVTMENAKAICKAANYDFERIDKAHLSFQNTRTPVDNITGWMISAIKENYSTNNEFADNFFKF